MSRPNVAKSRNDKTGKTVSAPTPAQVHDIIPGKFSDHDWNLMLDHDENDEFVSDIIEDVCTSALDIIYKNYMSKQLIPFSVCQAKDSIIQIIEWQFLARDEGEGNIIVDPGWCEDEEPEPAEPESWAQGSVPRTLATPRPEPIEEELEPIEQREMSKIIEETTEEAMDSDARADTTNIPFGGVPHERTIIQEDDPVLVVQGTAIETRDEEQQTSREEKREAAAPAAEKTTTTTKQKPKKYKKHFGPLRSAGLGKLTESLDKSEMELWQKEIGYDEQTPFSPSPTLLQMPNSCHSIMKLQAGRPPGHRDVIYDDRGNVISLTKIQPEELPSHKVPTRYAVLPQDKTERIKTRAMIVDPEVEAAQARLEAMRTGRYIAGARKPAPPREPKPSTSSKSTHSRRTGGTQFTLRTGVSTRTAKTDKSTVLDGPRSPLPPPLLESMEVSPGVIVREGDRVKKGPRQRPKQEDLIATAIARGLRSIRLNQVQASLAVSQILESHTPVVKPLIGNSPIPPISASQQVQ